MTTDTPSTTQAVETPAQAAEVTEVKAVEPQEEAFDKDRAMLTIHKLRESEKEAKKQLKELEALKAEKTKREEAEMTESQRLQKQLDELAKEKISLELSIIRRDVVTETGIPAIFADRLKGETKEEMLADAQELLKTLPQLKQNPKLPPTNPEAANTKISDDERRAYLGLRR